jgi:plasmid stabilization system protein ParE
MKKYDVRISTSAQQDIFRIIDYISEIYKAPITAEKYLTGLYDSIFSLHNYAESIPISTKTDILKYGINARSIVYKKLIVVYTVHYDVVIVQAVVSGALIEG